MPDDDPVSDRRPLDEGRLAGAPWPVEVTARTESTNGTLVERARAGAEPQVLVTEHQTAGRGRLARTWQTPDRAALTFSVLLRPRAAAERWPWLPLLVGYAVRTALSGLPDLTAGVGLKWPNDVLVGERKVAGILVERVDGPGPSGAAAVVGVGLNVSQTAAELPVPAATSLALEGPAAVGRTDLLLTLLGELHRVLEIWEEGPQQDVFLQTTYARQCVTLGRPVRAELPDGQTLTGTAVEIDGHGRLVVETSAGRRTVGAGDVVHVRTGPPGPAPVP